jgi:hypothetical protein
MKKVNKTKSAKEVLKEILNKNWVNYRKDLHPIDRRMDVLREKNVAGMSSENVRLLINEIVRAFAKDGTYLEVGSLQGCSLLSAALFNESTRCIGIDDFSEFNKYGVNEEMLRENLSKFNEPRNIGFYRGNYKKEMIKIFSREPNLKIDVYFYDGSHAYEEQMKGLIEMLPHLAKKCIIIVDDINWEQVEKANKDFLKKQKDFKSILKIKTKGNYSKDWWNGIEIIARE